MVGEGSFGIALCLSTGSDLVWVGADVIRIIGNFTACVVEAKGGLRRPKSKFLERA